ncbi:MAG: sodium-dependent transporter, partial [Cetobacterium sp.]
MTYSSYLPKKTDINNSAFMTAFANCSFEFICAIGVFSILGVMAFSSGVPVNEVVSSGIGLAFIAFPKVFSLMGIWGNILGVLFFMCLTFAGITSAVSLVEAISAAIVDKFNIERKIVVTRISICGFLLSIIFATNSGLYILDIMDNFINNYGIVSVGLLESFVIGWYLNADIIRNHTNSISYIRIGSWWNIIIKYITPLFLFLILIQSIFNEFKAPYGGYSGWALTVYGWIIILIGILGAIILSKKTWKSN